MNDIPEEYWKREITPETLNELLVRGRESDFVFQAYTYCGRKAQSLPFLGYYVLELREENFDDDVPECAMHLFARQNLFQDPQFRLSVQLGDGN